LFRNDRLQILQENENEWYLQNSRKKYSERESLEEFATEISKIKGAYFDLYGQNDSQEMQLSHFRAFQNVRLIPSFFLEFEKGILSLPFGHPWPYMPLLILRHHYRSAWRMIQDEKERLEKKPKTKFKATAEETNGNGYGDEDEDDEERMNEELKKIVLKMCGPTDSKFLFLILRFIFCIEVTVNTLTPTALSQFHFSSWICDIFYLTSSFILTHSLYREPSMAYLLSDLYHHFLCQSFQRKQPMQNALCFDCGNGEDVNFDGNTISLIERSMAHEGGMVTFLTSVVDHYLSSAFGSEVFASYLLFYLQYRSADGRSTQQLLPPHPEYEKMREMVWISIADVSHTFLQAQLPYPTFSFFFPIEKNEKILNVMAQLICNKRTAGLSKLVQDSVNIVSEKSLSGGLTHLYTPFYCFVLHHLHHFILRQSGGAPIVAANLLRKIGLEADKVSSDRIILLKKFHLFFISCVVK
jgi:hypothetical protein